MKQIGFSFLILMISSLTFGQTLKFQAGTSHSTLKWEAKGLYSNPFIKDKLIGPSYSIGLDYFDKKFFNLSSNIGFLRKGAKRDINIYDENNVKIGTDIEKVPLDYLLANTVIDLKYPINESITPFICFGPQFGYLISSADYFHVEKSLNLLENTSFGIIFGGGIKYNMPNIQLGLRAEYDFAFTKLIDTLESYSFVGKEISTRTFMINFTIGYKLR